MGLARLMGGQKQFVQRLQKVFDDGNYDPANEPDIAYPYLFSRFKGEEWRTQKLTRQLVDKYFTNTPGGIPGNDDTGTMSAWAVFTMMGFYPDCPGVFDAVTLHLPSHDLRLQTKGEGVYVNRILVDGKPLSSFRTDHKTLVGARTLTFERSTTH